MSEPRRGKGRRDNGLDAALWTPLRDVDPRVGEHLLDLLREAGIAAYLEPASDVSPYTRTVWLPSPPSDRLYVDRARRVEARGLVERNADEHARAHPPAGRRMRRDLDEEAEWRRIVAELEAEGGSVPDLFALDPPEGPAPDAPPSGSHGGAPDQGPRSGPATGSGSPPPAPTGPAAPPTPLPGTPPAGRHPTTSSSGPAAHAAGPGARPAGPAARPVTDEPPRRRRTDPPPAGPAAGATGSTAALGPGTPAAPPEPSAPPSHRAAPPSPRHAAPEPPPSRPPAPPAGPSDELPPELQDEHYEPPPPPPIRPPSPASLYAVLLIAVGALLIVAPGVVDLAGDVALFLGVAAVAGGVAVLVSRMRDRSGDDGDDGAVV